MCHPPPSEDHTHCRPSYKGFRELDLVMLPMRGSHLMSGCSVLGLRTLGCGWGTMETPIHKEGWMNSPESEALMSIHPFMCVYVTASVRVWVCVCASATVGMGTHTHVLSFHPVDTAQIVRLSNKSPSLLMVERCGTEGCCEATVSGEGAGQILKNSPAHFECGRIQGMKVLLSFYMQM